MALRKRNPRPAKAKHGNLFGESEILMSIICGKTGSGKTQLLFDCLTTEGILDFDNLIIFTKTNEQYFYQFLKYGFQNNLNKSSIKYLYKEYLENEDIDLTVEDFCFEASKNKDMLNNSKPINVILESKNIPYPKELDKTKKNLIIFDDCVNNKNQEIQKEYFTNGRHNGCSVFYITQRYYDVEKIIRNNANILILFSQPDRSLHSLKQNIPIDNIEDVIKTAKRSWQNKYGYIVINTDSMDNNMTTNLMKCQMTDF